MTTIIAPADVGVDATRWPDVAEVPPVSWRTPFGRLLIRRAERRLPLQLLDRPAAGDAGNGERIVCADPERLARRIARDGLIGFGESYMAGEWDSPDLAALMEALATHYDELVPRGSRWLRRWILPRIAGRDANTPSGSRRNIGHHYDLSNRLFALFLDETMTYSSALFAPGESRTASSLAVAQRRKVDRLLDQCRVGCGTRLLEIGTGWGELAMNAGRRGADVLTITLSQEQRELARSRVQAAGLADRVDVHLDDYRSIQGTFDAVVSVEMIEAVGADYWATYFRKIDDVLAPGGRVGIQAITKAHRQFRGERQTYSWINKYIFPGGQIPSVEAIDNVLRSDTRLRIVARRAFGLDYADTLAIWRERFNEAGDDLAALGFDEVFRRMWDFYLASSEAGFRSRRLDVEQIILRRAD
jgi:cyclopropane-fatty-acyl-phospholipid synthase